MSTVEEDDEQDLTRRQRREHARENRKALEEAEAANVARRKRLIQLGSVIGAVVVIVAVILIATSGGSKSTPTKIVAGNPIGKQVAAALQGIPQNGNTLGNPKAPVTLVYYGDLQCPICKDFTLGALPTLIQKYAKAGKLRIEYRNLETATREPETFRTQQVAALAAGTQQKLWDYIEVFYREQQEEGSEYVSEKFLQGIAQQVLGLNLTSWTTARSSEKFANTIASDAQSAANSGFTGTPSFLVGKTGAPGQKLEYQSLSDPASFESAIDKLLSS